MSKTRDAGVGLDRLEAIMLPKGKKYIFGIGIDDYLHLSKLRNATNDVIDVVTLLIERYDFERNNMVLLKNKEATRDNIVDQLHAYTQLETLSEHDSLLIYFSGHGILDNIDDGYWAPIDAQPGKFSSLIPNSTVRDKIKGMKCRHVLLISDSCFSGSLISKSEEGFLRNNLVAAELEQKKSRRILTSGGHNELVSDGSGRNSPFAEAILSELRYNSKPQLIMDDLFQNVRINTHSNSYQMPEFERLHLAGDKSGSFIFYLKNTPQVEIIKNSHLRSEQHVPNRTVEHEAEQNRLKKEKDQNREEQVVRKKEQMWEAEKAKHITEEREEQVALRKELMREVEKAKLIAEELAKNELDDNSDWLRADRINTEAAYYDYILKHPEGSQVGRARLRMKEIGDKEAYQRRDK